MESLLISVRLLGNPFPRNKLLLLPFQKSAFFSFFFFFFLSLCRFPIRQGALHVRKGYPELVIPSSQGWGIGLQSRALTYPLFFFLFFCVSFFNDFSLTTLRTNYHLP